MFEGTYSNIHSKPKTRHSMLAKKKGLEFVLDEHVLFEERDILLHYIEDLKELLELTTAVQVIQGVHRLEAALNKMDERYPDIDLPKLKDFYQELSPLLMQKYWELRTNPVTEESTDHLFLESLFIAIEEEIYIWQEKTS